MTANDSMALADVYGSLRRSVAAAGGTSAFAKMHGISLGYVSDAVNARCEPGPAILRVLGLQKVTRYQHTGVGE